MKTKVRIVFDTGLIPGKADAILIPTECGPDVTYAFGGYDAYDDHGKYEYSGEIIALTLEEGDERIASVLALLEKHGTDPDVSRYDEYSEEDLQTARLLKMSAGNEHLQSKASELGTKYDLKDACPHCGTGAKQSWYQRVKRKDLKVIHEHRALMGGRHIIVDATIRKMLVNAGITGISFAEVHARDEVGDWIPIDRFQIIIEHTMPPMCTEPTELDEKHMCQVCRRGGRFSFPDQPYRKEDLVDVCDFNLTWEWFGFHTFNGNVRDSQIPSPLVLVTPKVMNLFREARVKTFKWTPVGIEA